MAKIIVVTSGKGGVGKTTTSAAISSGLALSGKKTVVIDFDIGLRNLDLVMNCERRVVYDFVNVINQESTLHQALIKDKRCENLFILPASQTRDKDALTKEGVERILAELVDDGFEYIICDSPAGIEHGAFMALYFADIAIVVANPEVSSVRDSDRILGILQSKSRRAEQGKRVDELLLITRYNPERVARGDMLAIDDVEGILATNLLGVIPESESVLKASNQGVPVIHDQDSRAGLAYQDAVGRLLGEEVAHRFITVEKKGILNRLLGRTA
ncbi:Septum site-determining protein MinD [Sinobacterium norvegicum]|uniref:Septum site-determining protein MinD n=1 Tax=Sinobacterium norvegicum TaxID=1641715 RepID=A0ABN8ELB8_9GAMM|nr:septum site-determining protein MinD [Sinobacterium norvegicum]CAH0992483.1 Septum site-determining protein MinD [Sinobacterium norvegicum]